MGFASRCWIGAAAQLGVVRAKAAYQRQRLYLLDRTNLWLASAESGQMASPSSSSKRSWLLALYQAGPEPRLWGCTRHREELGCPLVCATKLPPVPLCTRSEERRAGASLRSKRSYLGSCRVARPRGWGANAPSAVDSAAETPRSGRVRGGARTTSRWSCPLNLGYVVLGSARESVWGLRRWWIGAAAQLGVLPTQGRPIGKAMLLPRIQYRGKKSISRGERRTSAARVHRGTPRWCRPGTAKALVVPRRAPLVYRPGSRRRGFLPIPPRHRKFWGRASGLG